MSPLSLTIAFLALFDIACGAWPVARHASVFHRFGAEGLVAAVSSIAIVRESGAHLALVGGALFATASVFTRSRSPARASGAVEAAIVVVAGYPVASALAFVGAVAAAAALAGQSPSMFLQKAREFLVPSDLVVGFIRTAIYAIPCATWAAFAPRMRPATTRGLAMQMAVVMLACQALFVIEAISLSGDGGGSVWEKSGVPSIPPSPR